MGEFDWIERYLAPLAGEGAFNLKDDAALLDIPDGHGLCVTLDAILEGVHFLESDPVDTVAQKALRVNLSDCIAKGAKPHAYSLALGVPDRWTDREMASFCEGLARDQSLFGIELTGGDTYRSPERLCVSVTLIGLVPDKVSYRNRGGANVGDLLAVTGTLGNAALGLKAAKDELEVKIAQDLIEAYRIPQPPLGFHMPLRMATASMDISDGLLGDARKLALASEVSFEIVREDLPLVPEVRQLLSQHNDLWLSITTGGDDYQTLFTIHPDQWRQMREQADNLGIGITVIGEAKERSDAPVTLFVEGVPMVFEKDSYSHF